MMVRRLLLLLLCLLGLGPLVIAAGPEVIQYDGKIGHIAKLQGGRLVSVYTLGRPREEMRLAGPEQPAYIRYSSDHGRTWSPAKVAFSYQAGRGTMSQYRQSVGPYLLLDRRGQLHLFDLRFYGYVEWGNPSALGLVELFHNLSTDEGRTWTLPRRIDMAHHYVAAIESVIELSTGRLLLAMNYATENYLIERGEYEYRILTIFSDDGGKSWQLGPDNVAVPLGPGLGHPGAIEPVMAELKDGRVWMLFRSQYGVLYQTFSSDGGSSWEPSSPTAFQAANAPAGILRLSDGRLVLCWNDWSSYPGGKIFRNGRQYLFIAVSQDDGKTWSPSKMVARPRSKEVGNAQMRYPFLCETADGFILLRFHRIEASLNLRERELLRLDPDWIGK